MFLIVVATIGTFIGIAVILGNAKEGAVSDAIQIVMPDTMQTTTN